MPSFDHIVVGGGTAGAFWPRACQTIPIEQCCWSRRALTMWMRRRCHGPWPTVSSCPSEIRTTGDWTRRSRLGDGGHWPAAA